MAYSDGRSSRSSATTSAAEAAGPDLPNASLLAGLESLGRDLELAGHESGSFGPGDYVFPSGVYIHEYDPDTRTWNATSDLIPVG